MNMVKDHRFLYRREGRSSSSDGGGDGSSSSDGGGGGGSSSSSSSSSSNKINYIVGGSSEYSKGPSLSIQEGRPILKCNQLFSLL